MRGRVVIIALVLRKIASILQLAGKFSVTDDGLTADTGLNLKTFTVELTVTL